MNLIKPLFTLIALSALLLTSCGEPKVDLDAELKKHPDIHVSWKGQDDAPQVEGSFCSDVLCTDVGTPNWSAMTFTPFTNGTDFRVHINTDYTISELTISLKNTEGKTMQNNLPHTDEPNNTYTVSEPFKHTGELILYIKVRFEEGGYGESYFPLSVE